MPHLTDHNFAVVDADAHAELYAEVAEQEAVHFSKFVQHLQSSPDGAQAYLVRTASRQAKQSHHAVTDVLVDVAIVLQDRLAHTQKVTIQHVDDVVRQVGLREGS